MCFTPYSFIFRQSSVAVTVLTCSHPWIATMPALASMPAAIASAPNFSTISFKNSGSSTAFVPMITRFTPKESIFLTASSERIPPPISTGIFTEETIFLMVSSFTERPASAPSKSTRCKKVAFFSCQRAAISSGCSEYTVIFLNFPWHRRTHLPFFISIAGYSCIICLLFLFYVLSESFCT